MGRYDLTEFERRVISPLLAKEPRGVSQPKQPICFSPHLYKARNFVEHFFNKIKHFRRIPTRYDRLVESYLA
jgi:transposase